MKRLLILLITLLLVSCAPNIKKPDFKEDNGHNDIYYHIFVRSFADSNNDGIGDLNGITNSLDELKDFGITALFLSPINPSPSYHGYDVIDYYDVNEDFGTLDDLDNLINEANKRGLKIILDLVINHTSDKHPWYLEAKSNSNSKYRDYYIWNGNEAYESFVGGMKDLNFYNEDVKNEIKRMMDFYLEKGIFGFRIDAAKHLIESKNPTFDNAFLLLEFNQYIKENYPNSFIVSEIYEYFYPITAEYFIGSDSVFNFYIEGEVANKLGRGTNSSLFVSNLAKSYDKIREVNPFFVDSPFLTNHDQDRLASRTGFNFGKLRLAANILLTLPGSPFIYYGEELGMKGQRKFDQGQYIVGYGQAYDEFRRTPYLFSDSRKTTWFIDLDNLDTASYDEQKSDENSLYNHYKNLINIRKNNPSLMYGNSFIPYKDNNYLIQGYIRTYENGDFKEAILVLHNFSEKMVEIDLNYISLLYGDSNKIMPYDSLIVEIDFNSIGEYS